MTWRPNAPQGRESAKIRYLTTHYTQGRGLDIGCGAEKLWPSSIGVDSGKQWGRPVADITGDGSDLSMFADGSMDYVFSSHFLEHVTDYRACLAEWWRTIKTGGFLVLYLPHADHYPRIGCPGANPDHKHDFRPEDIGRAMALAARSGFKLVEDETRTGGNEYSFFQVYRKRDDGQFIADPWQKPDRNCLVIRYGGFGDMIMASSILPGLKKDGWHVTVNTTPEKAKILMADPHVDDFWTQATDQVPNKDLGEYWAALAERYDRVVNLSESIEGAVLAIPGRSVYGASPEARRALMDRNYVEFTHLWAQVPGPFNPRFYPSEDEDENADEIVTGLTGHAPVVGWVMSGSSVNKIYPHQAPAVCQILNARPDAHVVLIGAKEPKDEGLQATILRSVRMFCGPDAASRVHPMAGAWTPRQAFTIAQHCDVVVGPETGVMNAVGHEANRKVVLLSHSSVENLTRDWVNTVSLTAGEADHRLHSGEGEHMDQDPETGCDPRLAGVMPEQIAEAVLSGLPARWVDAERVRFHAPSSPESVRGWAMGADGNFQEFPADAPEAAE